MKFKIIASSLVVILLAVSAARAGDSPDQKRDKTRKMARTLVANCVLVPAIGFLLVRVLPLTPEARIGIFLLAAIPGTPIALQFTRMAKTRLAFGAAITFVLSLVSIAMAPLAIEAMPEMVQRNERPLLLLITQIALYIALPLCAGVWAARYAPKITPRLELPLGLLATVVFLFLMWETRRQSRPDGIHVGLWDQSRVRSGDPQKASVWVTCGIAI
jgi:BASS family bile acid:Na+ symporter